MSYSDIENKLNSGKIIILDGGMGAELEKLGASMDNNLWSGRCSVDNPEIVYKAHQNFIQSGSDIITTNTYASTPISMKEYGYENHIEEWNKASVKIAKNVIDNSNYNVCVAGSVSTYGSWDRIEPKFLKPGFLKQLSILSEAGVDLIILEAMTSSTRTIEALLDCSNEFDISIWLSISCALDRDRNQLMLGYQENISNSEAFFYDDFENSINELKKKFDEKEILDTGLFYKNEKYNRYVNRFHSRIIFPIKNLTGDVIAFGGRNINNENTAKYINSPETEFYKKGRHIFNLDKAKSARNNEQEVIVVEGYMDAISLCSKGFKNVVAPLGTAMTERQLNLIWSLVDSPIICFDGDKAGKNAAERVIELAVPNLKPGKNIRFINLNDGLDPDDYVNKNGIKSFFSLAEDSTPLNEQIWKNYFKRADVSTPEGKANLEKELRSILMQINDKNIRKHYGLYFKESMNSVFYDNKSSPIRYDKKNKLNTFDKIKIRDSKVGSGETIPSGLETLLVSGILIYPEILENNIENFESSVIDHKLLSQIRDEIIDFLSKGITYNLVEIKSFIDRNYSEILIKELKFSKKYWSNYENSPIETISSIWVEIFEDDQHIKSLDIEINNFDKNVKSDSNEKRLISILEKKDIELKKITEKYGQ